jgi:hypothetical protein
MPYAPRYDRQTKAASLFISTEGKLLAQVAMSAIRGLIRDVLTPKGVVKTRSTIEFAAISQLDTSPKQVTHALKAWRDLTRISIATPNAGSRDAHAYSLGTPDSEQLQSCREVVAARCNLLRPQKLRNCSENYARAVFRHVRDRGAHQYLRIPNPCWLGRMPVPGNLNERADLVIGYRPSRGPETKLLIEVKAHREHFDITSPIFPKLLKTAAVSGWQPVLLVSHLSPRAVRFCHAIGVAAHVFGRRFLPLTDRETALLLWDENMCNGLFQFLTPRRVFRSDARLDERSFRDISVFANSEEWIDVALSRWANYRSRAEEIADALESKAWAELAELVPLGLWSRANAKR